MADTVTCARPEDTIRQAAQMMKEDATGFIPVVEGERVIGCVTDRDIVIRCVAEGHMDLLQEPVRHIMSTNIVTVKPEDDLDQAAGQMAGEQIRRLVVMEDGKIVGVLSHGNLVQATKGRESAQKATAGVTKGA